MPCTTCSTEARWDDSGTCLDFARRMYADRLRALVDPMHKALLTHGVGTGREGQQ